MKQVAGKIIFIDDQGYEKSLLEAALKQKDWDVSIEYFDNAESALKYFKFTEDDIFLIISDMHMPKMNGFELKKVIDKDPELSTKTIPFIFFSTSARDTEIAEAYEYRVQGYFMKPASVEEHAELLDVILKYWIRARHPNKQEVMR